jgi:chemotaxis protein CheX
MILGLGIAPGRDPGSTRAGDRTLTASVEVSGAWEGTTTLQCPATLASRVAAVMFGVQVGAARPDQVQDALGELANVVGGNVKALLPEPCRLSLPTVVEGVGYSTRVAGRAEVVARVSLSCAGEPVLVALLRRRSGVGNEAPRS